MQFLENSCSVFYIIPDLVSLERKNDRLTENVRGDLNKWKLSGGSQSLFK